MNIKIHHRNLDFLESYEKLIDRQTQKIRKMLPTFDPEVTDLTVTLERLTRGSQFQTSLVLSLPQRVISVEEIQDNPSSSLVRAFGELRRRIKRFKSQLNREKLWRKQPSLGGGEAVVEPVRELEGAISDNLEKVENYIRREIYHQIITGTIPPGVLEPHELVDDVFLQVTSKSNQRPLSVPLDQWMFRITRETLQARLRELESTRNQPRVEEDATQKVPWEDEGFNFYQPDEALQIEDILEDGASSNPEEILEKDELEQQLQRSIAKLPESFRESFVLYVLEGFTSDEIAMLTGKTPRQVIDEVENAREMLRNELKR
jgi:RNA polymerase sigma factor (sigma-70 family)